MNIKTKEHGNYNLLRIISAERNFLTGGVKAMYNRNDNRQVEERQRITNKTFSIYILTFKIITLL